MSPAPPDGSTARSAPAAGRRILVVDDIADNREVLARRLGRRGYLVTEAEDGPEALRLLATGACDLVLLDVAMPGMTGLEALKQIRQRRSARELPVIMVTADAQRETMDEARRLGANDYVTKPIDFAATLACIETHLSLAGAAVRLDDARQALKLARQVSAGPEAARQDSPRPDPPRPNSPAAPRS